MPGVAVSVKKDSSVARKTAIPPRKDEIKEPTPSEMNTRRSATKRAAEKPTAAKSGESMSAASVYTAIRELQKSVHDLKAGQKGIKESQNALRSGQKQLFSGYQELKEGQQTLLERTLPVPEMPAPKESTHQAATNTAVGPLTPPIESEAPEGGFFTTPFSSLKIPMIPINLEDLDFTPQFTEEGSVPTIPAEDRSDRVGLIEGPLPEPPPYEEPPTPEPAPEPASVEEDSRVFTQQESEPTTAPPIEEDSFLQSAAHESPFSIEGPPDDPFTISDSEQAAELSPQEPAAEETPFAVAPQPFGAKEYTHEPCDIEDPFAEALPNEGEDVTTPEIESEASPFAEAPVAAEEVPEEKTKSLSQQIAAAKQEQESSPFDPARKDLLTEPEKSGIVPIMATVLGLLAIVAGYLFFFTETFKPTKIAPPEDVPLVEFPAHGIALPDDDPRVAQAEEVATQFLLAKSKSEVEKVIRPVDANLLVDFWEPLTAPTIERLFQGRILENDRVEVDFLINDLKGKERILPLVKTGNEPFLVDWKSFAECEDTTLLGLAQGTLILDSGEEIDEGAIRSWLQSGKEMASNQNLGNFQVFKLHNFTEEVVAFAVVRKDSKEFEVLTEALSNSELRHKGKPAIRAVMRVKRIEEEDPKNKKPARLEILKVLATNWRDEDLADSGEETESQPDPVENSENSEEEGTATEEASTEGEANEEAENAEKEVNPDKLPPVPAEDAPLASHPEESPLIRVSFD